MILGERVRLRAVERDDLPRFVAWLNDPEVRRGLALSLPMSLAEEERWFEETLKQEPAARPLAIDAQEGDAWRHIGSCGFHNLDWRNRKAELGILIGEKSLWGRGYGQAAMRALLRHGFETLNLHRVYLRVYEYNERGLRLYRRLGFVEEGRLRRDHYEEGRYWDTLIMGMLREEWDTLQRGG